MPLHLIGLGLNDPEDVTLKGLKLIQNSSYIYLECYTSIFPGFSIEEIEKAFNLEVGTNLADGKNSKLKEPIIPADRTLVESGCEEMLKRAEDPETDVSLLVVGDPLC